MFILCISRYQKYRKLRFAVNVFDIARFMMFLPGHSLIMAIVMVIPIMIRHRSQVHTVRLLLSEDIGQIQILSLASRNHCPCLMRLSCKLIMGLAFIVRFMMAVSFQKLTSNWVWVVRAWRSFVRM